MKYNFNVVVVFTIFSFFIINYKSSAQVSDTLKKPFEVGIEAQFGYVLKHTEKLAPIETGMPFGFQLYYARKTTGTKPWHQLYNYPTYGGSLTYMSLGNKRVLGDAVLALAYLQLDVVKRKFSSISWSFGTGLAYCNTIYDAEKNPLNQAISSPISYTMQMQLAYFQQVNNKLKLKAGLGMTHISNGSLRKPNLGINVPIVNLGLFYNPLPGKIIYSKQELDPSKRDIKINAAYFVSFSRIDTATNKLYPAHVISLYASKRINHLHSILLGVDGVYDTSLQEEMDRQKGWGMHPNETIERMLVTVGHELTISRLALTSQVGIYVYKPFKSKSWSYQRFNLKYYVSKNLFIGSALRTHFGTADGIEIGAGVKI